MNDMATAMSFSKGVGMSKMQGFYEEPNLDHLHDDVIWRARAFTRERSSARYSEDLLAWAEQDHGGIPEWSKYEPTLWEEILVLCEGLGEIAAIDPQIIFPPTDPWESGYGFNP